MLTMIDCKARATDHRLGAANGCQVLGLILQRAESMSWEFLGMAWRL